jgi:hypothetical protein
MSDPPSVRPNPSIEGTAVSHLGPVIYVDHDTYEMGLYEAIKLLNAPF